MNAMENWEVELVAKETSSRKEVISFIMNAMKNWKVKLAEIGQTQTEVKIQRDISRVTHSRHCYW